MLKKIVYVFITTLLVSCIGGEKQERYTLGDMKYITRNSEKVSTYLKKQLVNKDVIILSYPEFIKDSYALIKYIAKVCDNFNFKGVYHPNLPDISGEGDIIDKLINTAPLFAFDSFVDLYTYLNQSNIEFVKLDKEKGKLFVITPDRDFDKVIKEVNKIYDKNLILPIVMAGTKDTIRFKELIDRIPLGKNIASIPLRNWRFPSLSNKYNSLILLGEIDSYTYVTPLDLYNLDNYTTAPLEFFDKNKSIFKSHHIKKMNNYLDKLVSEENKYLDIKVSSN